ncbi:MAG: amidohydrolase family protein [Betaproteobacteria bacterium]|nr:amidohydrolase family protein [Betaproteobacteria bacterium]
MHDLVIRNATLVDGSGVASRVADVAVDGARFAAVGEGVGAGRRVIDADGLLLTPGWVDIHTHYDGQATWDPQLTPSSWHGVTTAVFGNCGVGFAPVRRGTERYLINLMEGVEDIPETVLAEGIDFRWESFGEYLEALDAMPRIMDVGAQLPHGALRFYVMGERGADHTQAPSGEEIERMGRLLEEALAQGALGLTTSRTIKHRAKDGRYTPSLSAAEPELAGLARAMRRAGRGVIEVNSDFEGGDFERLRQVADLSQRPLSVLLLQMHHVPQRWRETLAGIRAARAAGLAVNGQVGSRAINIMMGLEASVHPFVSHPAWVALAGLSPAERAARLRSDAALRKKLWAERPDDDHTRWVAKLLERTFRFREPLDYEPDPARGVVAVARAAQRDPFDVALEWLLENDGRALLLHTFENYYDGNLEAVREMLEDPATVCGLADAGAHVGLLCDAGAPTTMLTHWARDRSRGPRLPLEKLVRKQTRDTALAYGLRDRGLVAAGYKADFNLIDFARLRARLPQLVYDLPAGGRRLIQRAEGYRATFVAGVEVMRDGEPTGALPGKLIRGPQPAPGAAGSAARATSA